MFLVHLLFQAFLLQTVHTFFCPFTFFLLICPSSSELFLTVSSYSNVSAAKSHLHNFWHLVHHTLSDSFGFFCLSFSVLHYSIPGYCSRHYHWHCPSTDTHDLFLSSSLELNVSINLGKYSFVDFSPWSYLFQQFLNTYIHSHLYPLFLGPLKI